MRVSIKSWYKNCKDGEGLGCQRSEIFKDCQIILGVITYFFFRVDLLGFGRVAIFIFRTFSDKLLHYWIIGFIVFRNTELSFHANVISTKIFDL